MNKPSNSTTLPLFRIINQSMNSHLAQSVALMVLIITSIPSFKWKWRFIQIETEERSHISGWCIDYKCQTYGWLIPAASIFAYRAYVNVVFWKACMFLWRTSHEKKQLRICFIIQITEALFQSYQLERLDQRLWNLRSTSLCQMWNMKGTRYTNICWFVHFG